MLGVTYIGTSSSMMLAKGATVRLTVSARSGLVGLFNIGAAAAAAVATVWDQLPSLKFGAVLSPKPAGDATVATMDIRLSRSATPAQLLDAVSGILPGVVVKDASVTRFELLNDDAARETATDRGATARDQITDEQETKNVDSSFTGSVKKVAGQVGAAVGVAEEVVIVAALAGLGIVLFLYGRPLLDLLKTRKRS